jgi:indolepyruvate ferredoxin oxidoreductase
MTDTTRSNKQHKTVPEAKVETKVLKGVMLVDKYNLDETRIFINGTQALVRLCLTQSKIDEKSGLDTAGYISGYRGSPLGSLDKQFGQAKKLLEPRNIIFEAGLNEDLAATAIWGTQQAELRGTGKYDGVYGMWYGKGPGADRSGDAFRHANLAGTSKHGGVLVVMGDDHTCESSTTCHQSEFALVDAMMPILNPANVSEVIHFGLHGWAMSRFSGLWVGLKCVKDNVESTASIHHDLNEFISRTPEIELPENGLNIQLNELPQAQEARLHRYKLDAARAYVQLNALDKIIYTGGKAPKIGIVTTGKSYMDTLQALEALGIDETLANTLGLALYKIAMPWPLEPKGIREFAENLDQIIVVEEKRALIEDQLKGVLYELDKRPKIIGKKDGAGQTLFQSELDLSPVQIALAIGQAVDALNPSAHLKTRIEHLTTLHNREIDILPIKRGLYFCAGCPHNSSTKVPEGSRGIAGIGCHWMAQFMERETSGYTHMGAEGANWIGEGKFSTTDHVFQNVGDGTFNHSGIMAMRAAVGSDVNMTFKLLYNDAVALTGGQTHDGDLDVYRIAGEIAAIGVQKLVLVTEDVSRINHGKLPDVCNVYPREELDAIQRDLRLIKGVTALIYDQTCATEQRRRRKYGTVDGIDKAANRRVVINESVCEGCGDCSAASNCVAVQPLETELGRKRKIDQFACNKDFSCVEGFCPSFVSIYGGELKKAEAKATSSSMMVLPEPERLADLSKPYSILITGVGGTGVITIGAFLGMAAHLEGKGCGIIDMAGLAQKGGSVMTHLKLAAKPEDIKTIRVAEGGADLLLGGDMVVSAGEKVLAMLNKDSHAIINAHEFMPGQFTFTPDLAMPTGLMKKRLIDAVKPDQSLFINTSELALKLFGDALASNMFLLGISYQKGLIPLSAQAIFKTIELNGVAVQMNKLAFDKGRHWVLESAKVEAEAGLVTTPKAEKTLDELIAHRADLLTQYQDKKYATHYRDLIAGLKAVDTSNKQKLTFAAAKYAYKLMAYKDEYEVARLYSNDAFKQSLKTQFKGSAGADFKVKIHMAPPLISRPDPITGKIKKQEFGAWILPLMAQLAKLKILRGTKFDPFGYTKERKDERGLSQEYQSLIADISRKMSLLDQDVALQLLEIPEYIRGFGHVKLKTIIKAQNLRVELMTKLIKIKTRENAL